MHDTTDLEQRGIPSVYIATTEFIDAAETQAEALGFEPAAVFVPHPIQDRTDEEVRAIADDVFPAIVKAIRQGEGTSVDS